MNLYLTNPQEESKRLQALKSYNVDFTTAEEHFDELTKLAASICDTPIALISLLDENDQWFKSAIGITAKKTPRNISFCHLAILGDTILEIEDALKDERFCNNPMVAGKPFIRFYAGAPLIDSDGYRLGTLCVIDRNPKKLTESQRTALTTLSKTIIRHFELKKSEKLLSESIVKVQEASLAKSEFLSTMSHEIRTPLNGIIGMSHLLLELIEDKDQLQFLKSIKFSSDNLMALVNDILDFSKIEAGMLKLEKMDFNLEELLSNLKKANEQKAQEKNISLKLKKDDDLPAYLEGDPVRLSQVFNNLISNAIKFTNKGSVILEVELKSKNNEKVQIQFSVKDTGTGIPVDKHQLIFQRFQQADHSIARTHGGTGLGLAITKKLLALMGSEIYIESEVGKGTTFTFSIDFTLSQTKSLLKPEHQELSKFDGSKILLVEDNDLNILIAKKIIEKWGIIVDVAKNGHEALIKIKENDYDIVLMDLRMPIMDGYETTREIRKMGGVYEALPVIALSASVFSLVEKSMDDSGLTDFISKPFIPEQLHQKLSKYLNTRLSPQTLKMAALR